MHRNRSIILGVGHHYDISGAQRERRFIQISARDLMHLHVIGKAGYGKSSWLAALYVTLLSQGVNVTLIDPAGDLARQVLRLLIATGYFEHNPDALERIIYLDIPSGAQQNRYVPLNLLSSRYDPNTIADNVMETFRRVWPALKGGTATNIEVLTQLGSYVLAANRLPLLPYLSHFFRNHHFRERLLEPITDPEIRASLALYGFSRGGQIASDIRPTIKKLVQLSLPPVLRYSLGQSSNVLDFRRLLDEGRSAIINLNLPSRGVVRVLGSLYTVFAELGARSRGDIRANKRAGRHVAIIDEFQNFTAQSGEALSAILEECRKYGLYLCLAHQHWGQVPESLRGAINQCEVDVTFHLEHSDAVVSAPHLNFPFVPFLPKPVLPNPLRPLNVTPQYYSRSEQREMHIEAITSLPKRHALIRLPNGLYQAKALDVSGDRVDERRLAEIEAAYLACYFHPQAEIEQEITETLARFGIDSNTKSGNDTIDITPEERGETADEEEDDYDLF